MFEPDASASGWKRFHQFADSFDDILDTGVMALDAAFEFRQLQHDLLVGGQSLSHADEGTDYEDAHFDGAHGI